MCWVRAPLNPFFLKSKYVFRQQVSMYDVLIKGGRVIDGTGSPWRKADVGVSDESIKRIGLISESDAERVIDARGLVVSPGWIDIHLHADHTVLGNPACLSFAHQGITTVTMGNCGLSMYPLTPEHKEDLIEYMLPFTYGLRIDWDWSTMDEFLARLDAVSLNLVPFIGHGSIRIAVMGFEDRTPTEDEFESMKKLLVDAMESGAHGLSTGLGYPPGMFTGEKELVDLMNVVKEYDGLYSTHMMDNESNLDDTIRLGKMTGVPVQVSHIGYSCGHQRQLRGRHESTTLRKIDEAREGGVDITADIYPYTFGSSLLTQAIPAWLHVGGVRTMLKRLEDPKVRIRLAEDFEKTGMDFDKVIVSFVKSDRNKPIEGLSLQEIAEKRSQNVVDTFCDILIDERAEAMNVTFWGNEEDVTTMVRHPAVMPCSDGWVLAPFGPLGAGKPHPRCYGAFPRYIRRYVREEKVFTLEEAVRRMTSMPASRMGLQDRGLLLEGLKADITVFDPENVKDLGTFENPHVYPEGISTVIVNGAITVDNGEHTGALNGKILKKL
jgi:N-acyl-D-amino-acid deacylase